ncbi:MAG: phosphate acyltransferase PlsX [Phycisphaerales bacterium]|nr:phosphate acyltransferase PlsX [Phycisphaerales bacterium]
MRLAVDVMGGDHAPDEILKGAIEALPSLAADDVLVLIGPKDVIEDVLRERRVRDDRIVIEPATQVIEMHESPVEAVKSKKDSTIVRMAVLGSHKAEKLGVPRADVVISAGNTGACVSAATMHMRRLPGAHRPGIAVTIPSFAGPMVMCDVGANPEPRPTHLAQYAVMAETYARHVLGVAQPRVAQINIGSEDSKGNDLTREVRDLLRKMPGLNYIGYLEGRDFLEGAADVIVCDGFVGNIMLKLAEGLAMSIFKALFGAIVEHDPELALRLEPVAKALFKKNDYHEYGGAPLLGVNGSCVICHGSSQARAMAAAIRNSRELVTSNLNEAIVRRLAEVAPVVDSGSQGPLDADSEDSSGAVLKARPASTKLPA